MRFFLTESPVKGWGHLDWLGPSVLRQPTLEREPVAQGGGWEGPEEAIAVVAANCLFSLSGGAGTFRVARIVGLVFRGLWVVSCNFRARLPESHTWIASTVRIY